MREDPMTDLLHELDPVEDNVIAMPDLMHGRLAELLQAAGAPSQDHELRGELAARTAFRSAAQSWPSRRRLRMRRGPAVVAATTLFFAFARASSAGFICAADSVNFCRATTA